MEIKIFTHIYITSYYFGTIVGILDSLNDGEILKLKVFEQLSLSVLLDATTSDRPKAPKEAEDPWKPKGPSNPWHELEGGAQITPNF